MGLFDGVFGKKKDAGMDFTETAGMGTDEIFVWAADQAIKKNPKDANAWATKGIGLTVLGKYEEAITACDQAINLDPNYAFAWYSKGLTLVSFSLISSGNRYEEAIIACDKAIKLDENYAPSWNVKGRALYHLGKFGESLTAFDQAIKIDPNYEDAKAGRDSAKCRLNK